MSAPLPKLPTLRALTAELRALHSAWSRPDAGGEYVRLCLTTEADAEHTPYPARWGAHAVGQIDSLCVALRRYWDGSAIDGSRHVYGWEYIPGSAERECDECEGVGVFLRGLPCSFACDECHGSGRVSVPSPFDAVAAARRLLAAAREAGVAK